MLKFFEKESRESILKLVQIVPERSHTILPGMIVLQTIANYFGCNEIRVSEFGVREGYLISNILHLQEK
jgi:exopolyphosphatase/guanosine-5'-triphosphate,3'-diphosphate pyrophosphatase